MAQRTLEWIAWLDHARIQSGMGTCCAEAQADGVPCPILGRECEICERALAHARMHDVAIRPNQTTFSLAK